MNDRVAEIMWKCTVPTEQSEEYSNSKGLVNNVDHKLDIGKFADMLVQDCALIAGLMEHQGRKNIGAVILDSFGVEV